jgi:hypothetical protein
MYDCVPNKDLKTIIFVLVCVCTKDNQPCRLYSKFPIIYCQKNNNFLICIPINLGLNIYIYIWTLVPESFSPTH